MCIRSCCKRSLVVVEGELVEGERVVSDVWGVSVWVVSLLVVVAAVEVYRCVVEAGWCADGTFQSELYVKYYRVVECGGWSDGDGVSCVCGCGCGCGGEWVVG